MPVKLLTAARMAEMLGQPLPRIEHILRTRNIEPVALAGPIRVYDRTCLARVRYAVNLTDARRSEQEVAQ